jgi:hypothetical protein
MSEEFEKKVINLLESINKKLETLVGSDQSSPSIKSEELSASIKSEEPTASIESEASSASIESKESSVKVESSPTRKPSEVAKLEEEKSKEEDETLVKTEGRRVCPNCGGTDFKEEPDKTRVLHQQGGLKIYAKKYICKNCGTELK